MKVFEAIGARLAEERVRHVFGLMGDGNLKLIPHLVGARGIEVIGARHESGAVAMADGYARASGEVGVATFTQGPGLTNALTALVTAQRGRTPLVVLSGNTPTAVRGLPQDIDQAPFWAAAGIEVQPWTPATAEAAVAEAFRRARAERRPIALDLPTDLQEAEAGGDPVPHLAPAPPRPQPAEADLDAAVAAIAAARRPVVIAGRGAVAAGARADLVALADHVGALLATSLPATGWFAGHPFAVGIAGGFASELGRRLLGEADCVIAFGASLNHFTTRGGTLLAPGTPIVQVDVDRGAFGRYVPTAVGIVGDAGPTARALRARLAPSDGARSESLAAEIARAGMAATGGAANGGGSAAGGAATGGATNRTASAGPLPDESGPDGIDPRALSRAVARLLPADRTLVVDGGHFMGFPSMEIPVSEPSRYVFTLDFGSIGLGLGAAVGAAVAHPGRVTVAAIGDGGLMMSLGELDSAVRRRLPIVVLVYNDEAFGAEMHFLRMSGIDDGESRFATPPLDAVARAMGARAHAISDLAQLDGLRDELTSLDGPLLLDCRITDRVRAVWLEEAFQRGTH